MTKKVPRGGAERGVPVGLLNLLDRLRDEAFARRVDEQVEPAETLGRSRDERSCAVCGPEVAVGASGSEHLPAVALEPSGDGGPIWPVPPVTSAFTTKNCKELYGVLTNNFLRCAASIFGQ